MDLDSVINNDIPTDNGEVEPTDRSPDSPGKETETERQRQTIIPTAHLDSVVNHNHNEIEVEEEGEYFKRLHW
jgi:hypothetical protein